MPKSVPTSRYAFVALAISLCAGPVPGLTSAALGQPCNDPFADATGDGDVDAEDFGHLQACLTGPDYAIPPESLDLCGCFDRPSPAWPVGDGHVDGDDQLRFEYCFSGPGLPADTACDDALSLSPVALVESGLSTQTASDGQQITARFHVFSTQPRDVQLACWLVGVDNRPLPDLANDITVHLSGGHQWCSRDFLVNLPPDGTPSAYDVHWEVLEDGVSLAADVRWGYLTVTPVATLQVPILMYHYFGPVAYDPYWVTTTAFLGQMRALRAYGYTSMFMQELMDCRAGLAPLPAKPILLTIDDGVENQYTQAFPVVADPEIDMKMTSFVIPGLMGVPDPVYTTMTWDQARTLQASGHFDIQSHSLTHPYLTQVSDEQLLHELAESRQLIEWELNKPGRFICYPYGDANGRVLDAAWQAGYLGGTAAGGGIEYTTLNKFALNRVFIDSRATVNYDPNDPPSFFMTLIGDPVPIPLIQVQSVTALNPVTQHAILWAHRGQSVVVRARATNSGPTAEVTASLSLSNGAKTYDSHLGEAGLADWAGPFNPGQQDFLWTWQIPLDAPHGTYTASISFHDVPYVLRWHISSPSPLLTVQTHFPAHRSRHH